MGLNAYFAYQVVGFHGTGPVTYGTALAAVFIEGWIFLALSLLGMRQWLVKLIPTSIKLASGAGIGLLLSLIGLSRGAGIGAISASADDPVTLAGCPAEYTNSFGECTSHRMRSPTVSNVKLTAQYSVVLTASRCGSASSVAVYLLPI